MSFNILKSRDHKRIDAERRYVQEVGHIEKAGFNRRELLRMGLVAGSAGLAGLYGMPNFRPYWAHADGLTLTSPPNTPFAEPLYIAPAMTPVTLNPAPTKGPNPAPSANATVLNKGEGTVSSLGFTEANRPEHQRWEEFLPARQYESIEMPVAHSFYPGVDGLPSSPIWTYVEPATGAVGPLRINARYGEPVIHRVHNALPMDNHGFGINQTSTHLHNGHTASESDGGPTHFYDSGHFKDFHYPNVRAGFSSTHPTSMLNEKTVQGDVRETMGFLWFHDHRFDFTAQNVYKGLASFYTLFSDDIDLDCNDETRGLRLPSGPYDIPMIFADKVFDPTTGELFFDRFNLDGILGDKYTVNGTIQPFLEVKKRKYRFRLLDAGPSRSYQFFLSNGQPFVQLSNDGNLLPRPLTRQSIRTHVSERVDVIVDFASANVGDRIYLQNRLEQTNGRGPTGNIIAPTNIVEFRVVGPDAVDDPSRIPDKLLDLPELRIPARSREWSFGRSNGAWQINGEFFDPNVIRATPRRNTAEVWTFKSGGGWGHPVHIHFEEFQVLSSNGKAPPIDQVARKDSVGMGRGAIGTTGVGEAKVFIQFRDFLGDYPLHCHNTVHEDHAMMLNWRIVP